MIFLGTLSKVPNFLSSPVRPFPRGCPRTFHHFSLIRQALLYWTLIFFILGTHWTPSCPEGFVTSCSLRIELLQPDLWMASSYVSALSLEYHLFREYFPVNTNLKGLPMCSCHLPCYRYTQSLFWNNHKQRKNRSVVPRRCSLSNLLGRCRWPGGPITLPC